LWFTESWQLISGYWKLISTNEDPNITNVSELRPHNSSGKVELLDTLSTKSAEKRSLHTVLQVGLQRHVPVSS